MRIPNPSKPHPTIVASADHTTKDVSLELFAGPGGMSEGLAMAGFTDVIGLDNDEAACATATAAGHSRVLTDLLTEQPGSGRVNLLHASPPCPGFSIAGKGEGRKDLGLLRIALRAMSLASKDDTRARLVERLHEKANDARSALSLVPMRWIMAREPESITLEQVPAVLPLWEAYADVLRDLGYHAWAGYLHAEQYGVPQTRKRAVLIASRTREVTMPTPTHSRYYSRTPDRLDEGAQKWVSMAEALGLARGVGMRSNYSVGGDLTRRGERMSSQPSLTVTSKIGRNKWINRADGTKVTVEEAGVLQSFRFDYPWHGNKGQRYQQVGDAVPPLLGYAMAQELLDSVEEAWS